MTSIYIGSMFSSSVVSCKLMKREMQFKLEIDMVERMHLKSPATRQSIAWLGPFGLASTAMSDLCVTILKLSLRRTKYFYLI